MESVFILLFLGFVYFIPALIGYSRNHNNADPIFIVNLLLGWVGIGWVVALVWALTDNVKTVKG